MGRKRIAFFGGTFDPPHKGHIAIASALMSKFELDEFVFIPAFHAPHKPHRKPTSAYDRFAMLCLATQNDRKARVSKMEIDLPERSYSVETLARLNDLMPEDDKFFVMGADSWMDIRTWREWETVLSMTSHIVITRPGHSIGFEHVTPSIRERIVDLRYGSDVAIAAVDGACRIYITDEVNCDISATSIRQDISSGGDRWSVDVPAEVANYIEKYQIYN